MGTDNEWANDSDGRGCFLSLVDVLGAIVRAVFSKLTSRERTYVVAFERVGRSRNVRPLTATARDADELAAKIYRHARPHLGSRAVHVDVDLDELRGFIMAGFRPAGRFTITAGDGS